MKDTLKIANFIIVNVQQHNLTITSRMLGNLLYIIAGNYYLKYHQLLLNEQFYRLGVGYQLDTINNTFDVHQNNLTPTTDNIQLTVSQSNFIAKQLKQISDYSYNQLAYQCSLLHKKLAESKLKLNNFEKEKA